MNECEDNWLATFSLVGLGLLTGWWRGLDTIAITGNALGRRAPLLGLEDVGVQEELAKEQEVAEVHDERPGDVGISSQALLLWRELLGLPHHIVDIAADDHLNELHGGDDERDLLGHVESHGLESVVGVHDGMYQIVHGNEPAAC